jgi:hypothetical protein
MTSLFDALPPNIFYLGNFAVIFYTINHVAVIVLMLMVFLFAFLRRVLLVAKKRLLCSCPSVCMSAAGTGRILHQIRCLKLFVKIRRDEPDLVQIAGK